MSARVPQGAGSMVPTAEPQKQLLWRHTKSGHHYRMLGIAIRETDLVPVVMYREIDHFSEVGPVWVRVADEFFDGRFTPYEGD